MCASGGGEGVRYLFLIRGSGGRRATTGEEDSPGAHTPSCRGRVAVSAGGRLSAAATRHGRPGLAAIEHDGDFQGSMPLLCGWLMQLAGWCLGVPGAAFRGLAVWVGHWEKSLCGNFPIVHRRPFSQLIAQLTAIGSERPRAAVRSQNQHSAAQPPLLDVTGPIFLPFFAVAADCMWVPTASTQPPKPAVKTTKTRSQNLAADCDFRPSQYKQRPGFNCYLVVRPQAHEHRPPTGRASRPDHPGER